MPLSHTWMRNIHWTNMKEKYICPMHPVKRGLCLIILFLILGICFLSARAATGEISDHTDPPPHPTNSNCNANGNNRKQHDPEAGQSLDENRPLLEEHRPLLEEQGDLQETMSDLQEKLNQLQNECDQLKSENKKLLHENDQLKSENKKLLHENEWRKARNKTDNITLDADTAHPNLSISGDQKSLKHEAQPLKVPPNPERFDSTVCVLGSEGFSIGKHYWEVDVMNSTDWDLGVARESIQRNGKLSLSPKEGFWALGLSGRDYWAKTDPWTRLMVQKKPKKIGVYLSYQEGQVTFFSVTDMSVLFTFNDCSFPGEVYPFFKNSHKETVMRISSIKDED